MRAREFIVEQMAKLDPDITAPMKDTYILPGLPSQDPYKTYRFGVALARAQGEMANADEGLPPFSAEGAFGELAVVVGFDDGIGPLIDKALAMTETPGGKRLVGTLQSQEPTAVNTVSPVTGFKGYPR